MVTVWLKSFFSFAGLFCALLHLLSTQTLELDKLQICLVGEKMWVFRLVALQFVSPWQNQQRLQVFCNDGDLNPNKS